MSKKLEEAHKQQDEVVRDNEKLVLILQQNDEKLDNLKQDYESKLKEKDKQSSDLQDRIQSYLYDLNGEPWGKIISKHEEQEVQMGKNQFNPTNNRINTSSLKDRQHKDTPEQSDHRRKDQEKRKGSDYDILFLHDSICHEIDMRRLIAGSNRKGVKVITYTIEDASAVVVRDELCTNYSVNCWNKQLEIPTGRGGVLPIFRPSKFSTHKIW